MFDEVGTGAYESGRDPFRPVAPLAAIYCFDANEAWVTWRTGICFSNRNV